MHIWHTVPRVMPDTTAMVIRLRRKMAAKNKGYQIAFLLKGYGAAFPVHPSIYVQFFYDHRGPEECQQQTQPAHNIETDCVHARSIDTAVGNILAVCVVTYAGQYACEASAMRVCWHMWTMAPSAWVTLPGRK